MKLLLYFFEFDFLGSSNCKKFDQFLIRSRNNNLDIYHNSQSYFDLPKWPIRNKSNKMNFLNQTLKGIDYIFIYIYIYIYMEREREKERYWLIWYEIGWIETSLQKNLGRWIDLSMYC